VPTSRDVGEAASGFNRSGKPDDRVTVRVTDACDNNWRWNLSTMNPLPNSPSNHPALESLLASVHVGIPRSHAAMTVFPLHLPADLGPDYVALDEAMTAGTLRVTEISTSGAVPQLQVRNASSRGVLLVDGEELVGAKQNRAVNLSLLLPGGFQGTIPVSCVEAGRWHSNSPEFKPSHTVIDRETRSRKSAAVSASLRESASLSSPKAQEDVWQSISELQAKAMHQSATGSSHDVFQAKERDLAVALAAFSTTPGQHGMLVFIRGVFAGLDLVSRLHPKLVRSYAMDALVAVGRPGRPPEGEPPPKAAAEGVLRRAAECSCRVHPAVGTGETVRCEGWEIFGTALVADAVPVHASFFGAPTGSHRTTQLADLLARRRQAHGGQP
jgi:hypothetical protein